MRAKYDKGINPKDIEEFQRVGAANVVIKRATSLTSVLAAERNNGLHREGAMRLRIREGNLPGWRNEDLFDPL